MLRSAWESPGVTTYVFIRRERLLAPTENYAPGLGIEQTPRPRRDGARPFWLRKLPPAPELEIDANLARKSTTNVRATSTQHFPAVTAGSENHNQGIETRRNQVRARIALVPCGYPEPRDCHPLYRDVYAAPHVCVDRGPDGLGFALARRSIRVDRRRSGRHGHAARDGDHSRDDRCTPGDAAL